MDSIYRVHRMFVDVLIFIYYLYPQLKYMVAIFICVII